MDIFFIVLLCWGAWKGFKTGLFIETISLLGLVIAVIVSFIFLHTFIQYLQPYFDAESGTGTFFAFFILTIGVYILISICARILKKVIDFTPFGFIDNFAGAAIGVFKTAFILSIFLWLLHTASFHLPESATENSVIYPSLTELAPSVVGILRNFIPFQDIFTYIKELIDQTN